MTEYYLTIGDAAQRLAVTPQTLRNWYASGKLSMLRLPTGRFRVPISEIERILQEQRHASKEND